ncbi:parathyroid hormone 2 receptor-like [Lithobates pipiens]
MATYWFHYALVIMAFLKEFLVKAQVYSGDTVTAEEQIYILLKAKVQCELNITVHLQEEGTEGSCLPEWDGLVCWPRGTPGKILAVSCPPYVYDFNHRGMVFRRCNANGTWDFVQNSNRSFSNYSECIRFLEPEMSRGKVTISSLC